MPKQQQSYQNTGAPFRAENGDFIARGQVFIPSSKDLSQRANKLRAVDSAPGASPARPEPEAGEGERWPGFEGVNFASDRAYELARDAGLGAIAFNGIPGGGADGAYRVEDVRAILGE